MAAAYTHFKIAPEQLRLLVLAYGLEHAYRVLCLDEIAQEMPHVRREAIRGELDRLAGEELVTKFSGRYCFNREIPAELRRAIERIVTASGTIKAS